MPLSICVATGAWPSFPGCAQTWALWPLRLAVPARAGRGAVATLPRDDDPGRAPLLPVGAPPGVKITRQAAASPPIRLEHGYDSLSPVVLSGTGPAAVLGGAVS